jgi:hypothetical protein
MNRSMTLAGGLALVASLACSGGLPQYVRGDIRSQGRAAIPADASVALMPSLVPGIVDASLATTIAESLERAGYRTAAPGDADVLIGYRHQSGSEGERRSSSDGFEALLRTEARMECPERFSQRLAIAAARSDRGQPAALLWLGELCSDGGGRGAAFYASTFARELMNGFGMNRTPRRFEFLVRERAPSATVIAASLPVEPAPVPKVARAQSESLELAQPRDDPAATPSPIPAPTPTSRLDSELAAELVEPGPTWSDATDACEQLARRPDVGCALRVELASGRPLLQLGYPTRAAALASWKQDIAETGAIFCETATRHGLFGQAAVLITAPDQRAERACTTLERRE